MLSGVAEWLIFTLLLYSKCRLCLFVSDHMEMRIYCRSIERLFGNWRTIHAVCRCAMERSHIVNFIWTIEILCQREECGCIIGFKDSANKIASHSSVQVFMIRLNWESTIELHFNVTPFRCSMPIIRSLFQLCLPCCQPMSVLGYVYVRVKIQKFFVPLTNIFCVMHAKTATWKYACEQEFDNKLPRILLIFHLSRGGGGCQLSPSWWCQNQTATQVKREENLNQIQSNTSTLKNLINNNLPRNYFRLIAIVNFLLHIISHAFDSETSGTWINCSTHNHFTLDTFNTVSHTHFKTKFIWQNDHFLCKMSCG